MKNLVLVLVVISFALLSVGCGAATKYINKGVKDACKNQDLVQSQLKGTKAETAINWSSMCGTP